MSHISYPSLACHWPESAGSHHLIRRWWVLNRVWLEVSLVYCLLSHGENTSATRQQRLAISPQYLWSQYFVMTDDRRDNWCLPWDRTEWFRCDEDTLLYQTHSLQTFPSPHGGSIKLLRNHQQSHHITSALNENNISIWCPWWGDCGGVHLTLVIATQISDSPQICSRVGDGDLLEKVHKISFNLELFDPEFIWTKNAHMKYF